MNHRGLTLATAGALVLAAFLLFAFLSRPSDETSLIPDPPVKDSAATSVAAQTPADSSSADSRVLPTQG
jgi:hypothetical protein